MRHTYRFLAEQVAGSAPEQLWCIRDEEFRHLQQVLRLPVGAEVEVFDGQGCWAQGCLRELRGKEAWVSSASPVFEAAPVAPLCLAVGALKPGFIDELLPSLVELGLDVLHVFMQEAVAKNRLQAKVTERWAKIVIAAAKQSKRARLPQVKAWESFPELLRELKSQYRRAYVLQPGASQDFLEQLQRDEQQGLRGGLCAVVGGEKGFAPEEELLLAQQGFQAVSLGPRILRAYTASIAAMTLLMASSRGGAPGP